MYQVYQLGENASIISSLLSSGPERKVKCYNGHFIIRQVFYTEEYGQIRKTYNNEFEIDYYKKLEEAIELQYYNKQNKIFLFKCY
jgi:Na+-transporting NADH:ubiquinone oxidoreductase subunit NqrF